VERNIREAQQSANQETKSSAGDKYETGRAMAQLEIEKFLSQLAELNKQHEDLSRINLGVGDDRVGTGSLVFTNQGNFFIAVNAGQIDCEGQKIFTVSPQAPISQKMFGLSVKDTFVLNGRSFTILSVA
jgi:transcription elongation GreA/GreB family factor